MSAAGQRRELAQGGASVGRRREGFMEERAFLFLKKENL